MDLIRKNRSRGLTLIEVMVALALVIVAVLGAMSFRFFCALDARKADVHVNASRLGLLLLEGWRGAGGETTFDPAILEDTAGDLDITPGQGVDPLAGMTQLGKYQVKLRKTEGFDVYYYVTLSYKDDFPIPNLRTLNAIVFWPKQYPDGGYGAGEGRSISMSTYAN